MKNWIKLFMFILNINIGLYFKIEANSIKNIPNANKVFLIGIPRAGTHLLENFFRILTGKLNGINRLFRHEVFQGSKTLENATQLFVPSLDVLNVCTNLLPNEYLLNHLTYRPEYEELLINKKIKIVLIIRHPAAQLVSRVFYTKSHHGYFPGLKHLSFNELLMGYIGQGSLPQQKFEDLYSSHINYLEKPKYKAISNIVKFYEGYLPWIKSPICYTVKFEDLVGPAGGGSKETQLREIKNISNHVGYKITDSRAEEIAEKLFGGTVTFREGSINGWKQYFSEEHMQAFKKEAEQLLAYLNY